MIQIKQRYSLNDFMSKIVLSDNLIVKDPSEFLIYPVSVGS